MQRLSDYEIIIRPKPIAEFRSLEDLQHWLDRQRQRESPDEIARRNERHERIVDLLEQYLRQKAS